jgi:predicted TIM-barrel fold metal-dependent hydrolase
MPDKFINSHAHIFTVGHAPDYFLKTVVPSKPVAKWLEQFLQRKPTRLAFKAIYFMVRKMVARDKRDLLERYIEFLEIGMAASQQEVFENVSATYRRYGDFGVVVLTQVLDCLDLEDRRSMHKNIVTQVAEVAELKRHAAYQQCILPFLGIDPRSAVTLSRDNWYEKYISKDYGFCGLKMYPAAGFFPFDIRLEPLWAWAEANEVPVMTHCTRGGSWYLGSQESLINTGAFSQHGINPDNEHYTSIQNRIAATLALSDIRKKNKVWCNVFGNPECYEPVLAKYPKLKICFAHLGGENEILRNKNGGGLDGYPSQLLDNNWFEAVLALMKKYENVYSDISYTLSSRDAIEHVRTTLNKPDMQDAFGKKLFQKLLYGTDFYMTQQEKQGSEPLLQKNFAELFSATEIQVMAYENPLLFLANKIFSVF